MRFYEFIQLTPAEIKASQKAQAMTQMLAAASTPPVAINKPAMAFNQVLRNRQRKPHPTIQQVTATQSPLQVIQKDKIDRLAGKISRGQAKLQQKVNDDDIIMAMRRVDAEKERQQKIPKPTVSAAIPTPIN